MSEIYIDSVDIDQLASVALKLTNDLKKVLEEEKRVAYRYERDIPLIEEKVRSLQEENKEIKTLNRAVQDKAKVTKKVLELTTYDKDPKVIRAATKELIELIEEFGV